jgi:lipopolysaccharide biosynthesis glycosyltransferase
MRLAPVISEREHTSRDGLPIRVAFGVDEAFVAHLASAIASIVAHRAPTHFQFYILHHGVCEFQAEQVESVAPGSSFHWLQVDDPVVLSMQAKEHITSATFFRLMVADILPANLERLIYLDCDVVAADDLASLWQEDLHGLPVGAVYDPGVDAHHFAQTWRLDLTCARYFNAGVLLIDLAAVRKGGQFRKALETMERLGARLPYSDQDALNLSLWGQWRELDWRWNVQRSMVLRQKGASTVGERGSGKRAGIVHFTSSHKPWHRAAYQPFGHLYWRYIRKTPFYGSVYKAAGMSALKLVRLWLRFHRLRRELR